MGYLSSQCDDLGNSDEELLLSSSREKLASFVRSDALLEEVQLDSIVKEGMVGPKGLCQMTMGLGFYSPYFELFFLMRFPRPVEFHITTFFAFINTERWKSVQLIRFGAGEGILARIYM